MKKVIVLITPETRNIGNSFINIGAQNLINHCLHSSEPVDVEIMEALDTANNAFNYPTKALPEYNKKIIERADWLIVIGGSCLSRYTINLFNELKELKVPKILLGAGFYEGIEKEIKIHHELPEHFDYIFVRDTASHAALSQKGKYTNVILSIDMAFWAHLKSFKVPDLAVPYTVINLDSPERGLQEVLYKKHKNSIMSRNDPSKTGVCNSDFGSKYRCFVAERATEYFKLYANAEYVATNRVHTFLACILAGTTCQTFMDYTSSYERFFLFEEIGLKLETAKTYTKEDYNKYSTKLYEKKLETERYLTNILMP